MINYIKLIFIIFFGALLFLFGKDNEFERKDTAYLKQVACSLAEKKVITDVQLTEKIVHNLEQDINSYVAHLDPQLKQYLSRWDERFEKFKNKIQLLKSYILQLKESGFEYKGLGGYQEYVPDPYEFRGEPLLYTMVGLKPISVIGMHESLWHEPRADINEYQPVKIINKVYSHDVMLDMIKSKPIAQIFAVSFDPVIPLKFIYESYKNQGIIVSPEFLKAFVDVPLHKVDKNNIRKWVGVFEGVFKSPISQAQDEKALMLGLQPVFFREKNKNPEWMDKSWIERIDLEGNKNYFRSIFIPGFVSLKDRNPYIILYGKLMEYLWISILGPSEYITEIGKRLIEWRKAPSETNFELPRGVNLQEYTRSMKEAEAEAACKFLNKFTS